MVRRPPAPSTASWSGVRMANYTAPAFEVAVDMGDPGKVELPRVEALVPQTTEWERAIPLLY